MEDLYPILSARYQGFPLLVVGLFGLIVGSFVGMCVYRIPRRVFFARNRSTCPACDTTIAWYDNIPLLSYLLLRGRCRACGAAISWHYPVAEAVTAGLAVALYLKFPFFSYHHGALEFNGPLTLVFGHLFVFCAAMVICTLTDIKWMMIPNAVTYPLIISGPIVAYFHPILTLQSSILGIIIGGGLFYLVGVLYQLVRKRVGLGFGDVKLLAAIGAMLGVEALTPTVLISCLGAFVAIAVLAALGRFRWHKPIPYGPFLALGAVGQLFVDIRLLMMHLL